MHESSKSILIVDDMSVDQRLLETTLKSLGYKVTCASSGKEALQLVELQQFSLIMLDVIMPVMDGIEVAKYLRKNSSTKDIPLIFVSSLSAPSSEILSGYNPDTIGYIEKPLKKTVIKEVVDSFFIKNTTIEKHAYIACRSKLFSKAFSKSCKTYGMTPIFMGSETKILEELEKCRPDLIFIQDKILDDPGHTIVDEIKSHDCFADSYLVIGSAEKDGLITAEHLEADFFLPIPFLKHQVAAIFRQVLNLPKRVVFVAPKKSDIEYSFGALQKLKYEVMWSPSAEEARVCIQEFFPDIIYSRYRFSEMDGAELCSIIKNKPIFKHMHFLIETENNTSKLISECFDAGADDIVLKSRSNTNKLKLITSLVSNPSHGRRNNVLLIEKRNTIKGKVARLLRRHNYNVVSTSDISEAKERVCKESFDLVIASYKVAFEDNWEFCIDLLSDKQTNNTPLIMLSSESHAADVKKLGNLLNLSDVIYTPFKNDEFMDAVQLVVEGAQSQIEKSELAKYVPQDAVKHVGEVVSGIKGANAEEKFISILFSDICSFTEKCEEMSAAVMVDLLNSFFDLMTEVIRSNNGIVDKFIGDAVVARFDTGNKNEDAMNASRAACDMFNALEEWNMTLGNDFQIRIGINSGDVVLGNIGSFKHLRNYTMIGDNVNVAQRLESEAPPMGCYIAEATRSLLDSSFEVGDLKYIKVKGKKIPVGACQLITSN